MKKCGGRGPGKVGFVWLQEKNSLAGALLHGGASLSTGTRDIDQYWRDAGKSPRRGTAVKGSLRRERQALVVVVTVRCCKGCKVSVDPAARLLASR